ncbi:hypothetical protein PSQ40_04745 [Curvibacter sp. HBC61]|uniref:UrcA family protein n=1 Tax=Curvibacter cyanobacteriorum TaxID=3026422 RepID=A0ABT5MUZ1_9BURK|nr:hypothetical protein [Curvibacter sp. HBC61]MDD0837873.1 hypothetical protein [Curvibacter sp. HBC61]
MTRTQSILGRAILAMAVTLSVGYIAAQDSLPSEHQAAQDVADEVHQVALDQAQLEGDLLFNQRAQAYGDMLCIRTAGPNTRAAWSGPEETLNCVPRVRARDRLVLVAGGER